MKMLDAHDTRLADALKRGCPELKDIPGATDGYCGLWESTPRVKNPDFSHLKREPQKRGG